MGSKGSGSSDPYAQVTLVRGADDQFSMEIHLWDKDWHGEDQPIANGSVKVPSASATKEGKFAVDLICVDAKLPKVPFRCNFQWTVSTGGQMVTTKRAVKRRKKHAKANSS